MAGYIPTYPQHATPRANARPAIPGWRRMLTILASITIVITLLLSIRPRPAAPHVSSVDPGAAVNAGNAGANAGNTVAAAAPANSVIAADFSPSVQYWAPQIAAWAQEFNLDPNLVATIMQVESCGDPQAISHAGAQGLFQVMPFHFQPGENSLDPDTNARRGLAYFVERLEQTAGDVGRAFAGYNGGHGAAGSGWDEWLPETQRYYVWTTGIYGELQQGASSATLQNWVKAGGGGLCQQAAERLGIN